MHKIKFKSHLQYGSCNFKWSLKKKTDRWIEKQLKSSVMGKKQPLSNTQKIIEITKYFRLHQSIKQMNAVLVCRGVVGLITCISAYETFDSL